MGSLTFLDADLSILGSVSLTIFVSQRACICGEGSLFCFGILVASLVFNGKLEEGVLIPATDSPVIFVSSNLGGNNSFLCSQAHNKIVSASFTVVFLIASFTVFASSGVILAPLFSSDFIAILVIPYFSRAKATILGLVTINHAIAPRGQVAAAPTVIAHNCLAILPVFIEEIACTSSNAFNALTFCQIQGRSSSSLLSFTSFPFPTILAT